MRGGLPGVAGLLLDDTRAYDLAALEKNGGMPIGPVLAS